MTQLFAIEFGVSREQGTRPHQEDEFACIDRLKESGVAYFAVFDGHASDELSSHAAKNVHNYVFASEFFVKKQYQEAIRDALKQEDAALFKQFQKTRGGSTATVALIADGHLYLGNLGDSRSVYGIISNGRVEGKRLSRDHKPEDSDEMRRIQAASGHVFNGRVEGSTSAINMSRALGDFSFKAPLNEQGADWIASDPFLASPVPVAQPLEFLIVASDGVWGVMNDQQAAEEVARLRQQGHKAASIAKAIADKCASTLYSDNVTVIVVFFEYGAQPHRGNVCISESAQC